MTLVVDASSVLAWQLGEPLTAPGAVASALRGRFVVPELWVTEMANGLVQAERRKRISTAEREEIAAGLSSLDVETAPSPGIGAIGRLAARTGLTAYDAEYLHLAANRGASLLTLDRRLASCAVREGVPLAPGSVAP